MAVTFKQNGGAITDTTAIKNIYSLDQDQNIKIDNFIYQEPDYEDQQIKVVSYRTPQAFAPHVGDYAGFDFHKNFEDNVDPLFEVLDIFGATYTGTNLNPPFYKIVLFSDYTITNANNLHIKVLEEHPSEERQINLYVGIGCKIVGYNIYIRLLFRNNLTNQDIYIRREYTTNNTITNYHPRYDQITATETTQEFNFIW